MEQTIDVQMCTIVIMGALDHEAAHISYVNTYTRKPAGAYARTRPSFLRVHQQAPHNNLVAKMRGKIL